MSPSLFSLRRPKIGLEKTALKNLHINCTRATFDDDDDAQKTHKNDGREGGRDAVVRRLRFGDGFVFSGGKRRRPFFDDDTQHYE